MWYHWVIFGLIFLIVPFSLTYFVNTVLKNIELTEEQKTHKNLTIGVYILLSWLYDLLYMAIFNKWVICAYIFGIIAIIISIVNTTKALINNQKAVKNILPFELIIVLALTIYLIYIIKDSTLQSIIMTIVAAVYGGLFTLIGVAWTIRKGDKDRQADLTRREQERKEDLERMEKERKEDLERLERVRREDIARIENERTEEEKKKAKPIFAFNMVYRELDTVEGKRICYDENPMNFKCEVLALLENSEHSSFTITRVYHDNKWWNIIANNVILPSKCVYFDFNFTEDVNNLFMEIKDGLDNAYYYEIKVLCLGLLARKQPNLSDNMLHTIRELKEITLEEINKRITKVNP